MIFDAWDGVKNSNPSRLWAGFFLPLCYAVYIYSMFFFSLHFVKFLLTTRTPATQVLTIPVRESLCGLWEPPAALAAGGLKLWSNPSTHAHRHKHKHIQTCHKSTYVVYRQNQTTVHNGTRGLFFLLSLTSSPLFPSFLKQTQLRRQLCCRC